MCRGRQGGAGREEAQLKPATKAGKGGRFVKTRRKLATKAGNAAGLVRARDDSHTVVTGVNQETYDFSVTARLQPDTKAANAAGLVRGLVIGGFGKIMLKARPTPL